jgi:hypothetical protein
MARRADDSGVKVLEHGDIYFLYSPKVEEEEVSRSEEIQRLLAVLHPRDKECIGCW